MMVSDLNAAPIASTQSISLNRPALYLSSAMHCDLSESRKMGFLSVEVGRHLELARSSSGSSFEEKRTHDK